MNEHADYWERNASDLFLDRPAIDEHAHRYHEAQRWQAGVQAVFGDAVAAFLDVAFDYVVGLNRVIS